jgi:HAD superfamily hydrolase (TIGR01490 family)
MARLVIFDLDHTLSPVNVSFAFGKYLYRTGSLSFYSMCCLVGAYALHKSGMLRIDSLHHLAFRRIFSNKTGSAIQKEVQAFLQKFNPETLFRPLLLQQLKQAKAENAHIWIQSSSPECLVLPIAEIVGISCVHASRYGVDCNGVYTKVVEVVNGEQKRKFLDQFLEKNLVSRKEVTAYSDSLLDLPLLEGVGRAVVVHPDEKLKKIARERNWEIWHEK